MVFISISEIFQNSIQPKPYINLERFFSEKGTIEQFNDEKLNCICH